MQKSTESIDLTKLAKQAMVQYNLIPDYPQSVLQEVAALTQPAKIEPSAKDLRDKLFFSIDNDDSRDLDQLTFAEALPNGNFKIYVAIADVDALVKKGSAIDHYAQNNTVSVYTPSKIFPMLPEKLSTNLTSLNEDQDREAIVVEATISLNGVLQENFDVYSATVHNHAKLAYNGVAAWLDKEKPAPSPRFDTVPGLVDQVQLQDRIAKLLNDNRQKKGSLTFETIEPHPIIKDNEVVEIGIVETNRARSIIEEFMIAANNATSKFLRNNRLPSLRRVVRTPKRWDRIVAIAAEYGEKLPADPDSKALNEFLIKRKDADPLRFPDLSLTFIKLLGRGEYVVEHPGEPPIGHFNLATRDYTHSTAPNRRFPDLITQRLIKSLLLHKQPAYTAQELESLARQCTDKETNADKVERRMRKCATILLLTDKIGQTFKGIVTGSSVAGTWVRIFDPPTEGKLVQGYERVDVGDQIVVKLVKLDINQGFIDFVKA